MIYRNGKKVESESSEQAEESESETALIPKSLVSGYNVEAGDEIKVKVVSVMDDELEIEYSHKDDEEDTPKSDMDAANSQLDAMAAPVEA